jgi:hypothetical protein
MMKTFVAALIVGIGVFAPAPMAAKAPTVKITIINAERAAPIVVTDPAVREFSVWAGPGVYINDIPQTTGFIGDWEKGPTAAPPDVLRRYRIAFYTGCKRSEAESCNTDRPQLSYVVFYVHDAATRQGYVYVPGRGEDWYDLNTRSILRGVEGDWFLASREWQEFVTPFLAGGR